MSFSFIFWLKNNRSLLPCIIGRIRGAAEDNIKTDAAVWSFTNWKRCQAWIKLVSCDYSPIIGLVHFFREAVIAPSQASWQNNLGIWVQKLIDFGRIIREIIQSKTDSTRPGYGTPSSVYFERDLERLEKDSYKFEMSGRETASRVWPEPTEEGKINGISRIMIMILSENSVFCQSTIFYSNQWHLLLLKNLKLLLQKLKLAIQKFKIWISSSGSVKVYFLLCVRLLSQARFLPKRGGISYA